MTIELDSSALDSAVADVRGTAHDLDAERRSLDRRVAAVLDGTWTGAAATSFGEAWDLWRAGAAEVVESLAAMADLIDACRGDLMHRDDATLVALQTVGGRMVQRLGGQA